jgi:hypothetical protein
VQLVAQGEDEGEAAAWTGEVATEPEFSGESVTLMVPAGAAASAPREGRNTRSAVQLTKIRSRMTSRRRYRTVNWAPRSTLMSCTPLPA